MQRLGPTKKEKLFGIMNCLCMLNGSLTLYWLWLWIVMQRLGPQKKKINWFGHWTVLIRLWGVKLCRDGRPKADLLVGRCHPNKILLSRDYLCKDLLPRKKKREERLFRTLDRPHRLSGCLTFQKRWKTKSLSGNLFYPKTQNVLEAYSI